MPATPSDRDRSNSPGSSLLEGIVDPKMLQILRLLVARQDEHFHVQKLARESKVPLATTHRYIKDLVKSELLEVVPVDKLKLYRLANNDKTKVLKTLLGGGAL